jgi:hypothetical protein
LDTASIADEEGEAMPEEEFAYAFTVLNRKVH